ncbi:MAG: hypothetical protein ACYDIA_07690, partial [Candidatus Humimicrobiaceae bacterium]
VITIVPDHLFTFVRDMACKTCNKIYCVKLFSIISILRLIYNFYSFNSMENGKLIYTEFNKKRGFIYD